MRLEPGQVAVITGAASGIGRALAHACADREMKLVLADLDAGALDDATADLLAAGADARAVPTDVRDPAAVEALRDAAVGAFGTVHLVCNNAGVGGGGRTWETPLELWRWVLDVDLWSVIHGVRAFVPLLIEQGAGHVLNTASAAGLLPIPTLAPYVVAKHAVVALSENLELELEGTGVGVSVLCPMFVRTRIYEFDRHLPDDVRDALDPPEDAAERRQALQQMVESGMDPADVARQTLDSIDAGHLYILTHDQLADRLRERTQRIIGG
jgi:short-subunit dehydrogenase